MKNTALDLMADWLRNRLEAAGWEWLAAALAETSRGEVSPRSLDIAFGLVPRRLGKAALALGDEELAAAERCLPGWRPGAWSLADAGRILLLASLPGEGFASHFRRLRETAEVSEAVSLFRGLPLYPDPVGLEGEVGEGLRGNMRSVFEAIAHDNPYPRLHFDEHRWNHMVLKAIFVGSRLAPIEGLDERANPELARILLDFVHERRAAGRPVPFEIWRCVGPYASGPALDDLQRELASAELGERQAAALGLAASAAPQAAARLALAPELAAEIAAGRLTWGVLQ